MKAGEQSISRKVGHIKYAYMSESVQVILVHSMLKLRIHFTDGLPTN
jgi:hypothetical protein